MKTIYISSLLALPWALNAGVYSGSTDAGSLIDPAITADSSLVVNWASEVIDYSPSAGVSTSFSDPSAALGAYNTSLVSLGDLSAAQIAAGEAPGSITLGFSAPFYDDEGFDFAIFENGFNFSGGLFAELAYVEVSSDGANFARFDSLSLNTAALAGAGGFSSWDSTNIYNLAGKHAGGYGTTFDLSTLSTNSLVLEGAVDLNAISYVRIIDIPGSGDYLDSEGNPILDAWLTSGSGGFDLRAVGALNSSSISLIPEPSSLSLWAAIASLSALTLYRRRR